MLIEKEHLFSSSLMIIASLLPILTILDAQTHTLFLSLSLSLSLSRQEAASHDAGGGRQFRCIAYASHAAVLAPLMSLLACSETRAPLSLPPPPTVMSHAFLTLQELQQSPPRFHSCLRQAVLLLNNGN